MRERKPLSLLVRNLRYATSPDRVRKFFEQFGEVRDVYLPLDYHTKLPRGFGFVEFCRDEDADNALRALSRHAILDGAEVSVTIAQQGRKSPDNMRNRERMPRDNDRGGYNRYSGSSRYGGNERYGNERYGNERYGSDRYGSSRYGSNERYGGNDRYVDDRYGERYGGGDRYGGDRYGAERYGGDRYGGDRYGSDRYAPDRGGDRYGGNGSRQKYYESSRSRYMSSSTSSKGRRRSRSHSYSRYHHHNNRNHENEEEGYHRYSRSRSPGGAHYDERGAGSRRHGQEEEDATSNQANGLGTATIDDMVGMDGSGSARRRSQDDGRHNGGAVILDSAAEGTSMADYDETDKEMLGGGLEERPAQTSTKYSDGRGTVGGSRNDVGYEDEDDEGYNNNHNHTSTNNAAMERDEPDEDDTTDRPISSKHNTHESRRSSKLSQDERSTDDLEQYRRRQREASVEKAHNAVEHEDERREAAAAALDKRGGAVTGAISASTSSHPDGYNGAPDEQDDDVNGLDTEDNGRVQYRQNMPQHHSQQHYSHHSQHQHRGHEDGDSTRRRSDDDQIEGHYSRQQQYTRRHPFNDDESRQVDSAGDSHRGGRLRSGAPLETNGSNSDVVDSRRLSDSGADLDGDHEVPSRRGVLSRRSPRERPTEASHRHHHRHPSSGDGHSAEEDN